MYSSKVTPVHFNSKISSQFKKYWNSFKLSNIKSSHNSRNISLIQLESFSSDDEKLIDDCDSSKFNSSDLDFPIDGGEFLLQLEAMHRVAEDEELNYDILSSPPLSRRFYTIQA